MEEAEKVFEIQRVIRDGEKNREEVKSLLVWPCSGLSSVEIFSLIGHDTNREISNGTKERQRVEYLITTCIFLPSAYGNAHKHKHIHFWQFLFDPSGFVASPQAGEQTIPMAIRSWSGVLSIPMLSASSLKSHLHALLHPQTTEMTWQSPRHFKHPLYFSLLPRQ